MGYSPVVERFWTSARNTICCFFLTGQSQRLPEVKASAIGDVFLNIDLFFINPISTKLGASFEALIN